MSNGKLLRECRCADPKACKQPVPGYLCRRVLDSGTLFDAALSQPEGVVVPMEPTEEMIEAASKMMLDRIKRRMVDDNDAPGLVGGIKECWKVMLSAAPPTSAQDEATAQQAEAGLTDLIRRLNNRAGNYPIPSDTIFHEAAAALTRSRRDAFEDTERLDLLESLSGRMYSAPNGKIWNLPVDIHLRLTNIAIYLRTHNGMNEKEYVGETVREALDAALGAEGKAT